MTHAAWGANRKPYGARKKHKSHEEARYDVFGLRRLDCNEFLYCSQPKQVGK